ncbi:gram-negative bacteria-binding protein 2-like isoform X1 [Drosophila mauritiana]|uniref:Gram-negative bacteria-binding protein 2-like isoform X1 n=1 Tax=Drosophila mauritiana TaxID=7226 RepID=A0A6P8JQ47_DROMA|nr:gram-negative bacteria-binding protein 2-like isoform X1 [Drosophila mauritiana]
MEISLWLALILSQLIGLDSFQVPQLLVNATENDPWIWASLPEDYRIRSVLFYTEFEGEKCPFYDYRLEPSIVHPWAIREYLGNGTLKISAVVETHQNETVIESFRIRSLGENSASVEPLLKFLPSSEKSIDCEKIRSSTKYCLPTISHHRGKPISCSGRLLFSESFGDNENPLKNWKHVVQSQLLEPHYEGVAFVNRKANSYVENNMLHLKVTKSNYGSKNPFYLENCTYTKRDANQRCGEKKYRLPFRKFMPPFDSAKLISLDTFKYCRIDIEAKMPIGEFLFPGLTLSSVNHDAIRIAIVRGNKKLTDFASNEIGGRTLYAGAILNDYGTRTYELEEFASSDDHYGNDFHTYTAIWKAESINFKIDGRTFAQITNSTIVQELSKNERHIELFLTVGGEYNFPDNRIPPEQKSYRNFETSLSSKIKKAVTNAPIWDQDVMIIKNINVYSTDEYEE